MTQSDRNRVGPPPAPPRRWHLDRDLIVSGAAVAISLCALGVSLVQTVVMRAQQHAAVWPRLTVALEVDSAALTLAVRNAGVGPAQIVWAQALLDGTPLDGWPTLLDRAATGSPAATPGHLRATLASLTDDVLVPGERKVVVGVADPLARAVAMLTPRVGLRACYCSVYDRCWRLENPRVGDALARERVTPVPGCERPATPLI